MIFFTLENWEQLEEPAKRALFFLRPLRDALALDVQHEAEDFLGKKDARETVEDLVGFTAPNRARSELVSKFTDRKRQSDAEKTEVLFLVVRRIARLEYEGCGIHGHDLKDA